MLTDEGKVADLLFNQCKHYESIIPGSIGVFLVACDAGAIAIGIVIPIKDIHFFVRIKNVCLRANPHSYFNFISG